MGGNMIFLLPPFFVISRTAATENFSSDRFLISTKAPFCAIISLLCTEGNVFFMGEQSKKVNISAGLLAHV